VEVRSPRQPRDCAAIRRRVLPLCEALNRQASCAPSRGLLLATTAFLTDREGKPDSARVHSPGPGIVRP